MNSINWKKICCKQKPSKTTARNRRSFSSPDFGESSCICICIYIKIIEHLDITFDRWPFQYQRGLKYGTGSPWRWTLEFTWWIECLLALYKRIAANWDKRFQGIREGSGYQIWWIFGKITNGLWLPPLIFGKSYCIFFNGYGCICKEVWGPDSMKCRHMISRDRCNTIHLLK